MRLLGGCRGWSLGREFYYSYQMINSVLSDFYNQLEELTSLNSWDIISQLKPIDRRLDKSIEEKIKTERKVFSIQLNNGDLIPQISTPNKKGDLISYPTQDSFNSKEVDYVKERLQNTSNHWIKCRYSHLLWNITKHTKYAEIALNSYLTIIDSVLVTNYNSYYLIDTIQYIKALVFIAEKSKVKRDQVKHKLIELTNEEQTPPIVKAHIIKTIEESKIFKPVELEFALKTLSSLVNISDNGSYSANQFVLNIAIKIAKRLQKNHSEYYIKLAENEGLVISNHPDEKDFVRLTSFGEMAILYKKGGDKEKSDKYFREYTRLKSKITLGKALRKFTEQENKTINEYLNDKSDSLLKHPVDIIMQYITSSNDLLIKNGLLHELVEKGYKNPLLNIFNITEFDENINFRKSSQQSSADNRRFEYFSSHYNLFVFPLFIKLFANGIINGKINYYSVYQSLKTNTWYGQRFKKSLIERDLDEETSWLSLFAPALHEYFAQIEMGFVMAGKLIPNYILCIDSLTLKFEGALRDFIRLTSGNTTIEKDGELREQTLEQLLSNRTILDSFTFEDITLFEYVFTNKGWNLRNNVAHCFYPYSSYSFEKATIVLLCILRLGRYRLK